MENPFKKKKIKPFEAGMIVNEDSLKIVAGTIDEKPAFLAFGKTEEQEKKLEAHVKASPESLDAGGSKKMMQRLAWDIKYNPEVFPNWTAWEGQNKDLMISSSATASGTAPPTAVTFEPVKNLSKEARKISVLKSGSEEEDI